MYRILIVAPAWVGDTVLAQPLMKRLHQRHGPELQLDVLAPAWTRPLLSRMPEVHASFENPFVHGDIKFRSRMRLGRSLAVQGYDQAIVLPNSLKSALVPFFAGIRKRTGFKGEQRYGLLNDLRKLDPVTLPTMAERFVWLAEEPGTPPLAESAMPRPQLSSSRAQQLATLSALGLQDETPALALCPGAEFGPAKRWPAAHFADLARRARQAGWQVWLLGSSKDSEDAEAIVQQAPGALNLCGKTSLTQAIDLLALSSQVVSNDSGLMHIAAALDRPLVAIYGSSSPDFTPPLSDKAKLAHLALECSPCFQRTCPLGHLQCLTELHPDRIWEKMHWHPAPVTAPSPDSLTVPHA
ncbi:lipopolysaccharide heptosyltransferase II [Leeia aquatica]|uniref:lipopolysaccharide heptosyltransferase II n=1 Tax=Leeia aquatica TaxID=2725557 RepID=A0A847SHD0_9NEIS|nr:lipopolysaccharide heptosyltransferase II [Leeia aquatica]NLR75322.1 lipopolysaccharide heptosyltransferase II [Leeia aquatica]